MLNAYWICRRELTSFFFSPIAYVTLAAWTVLMGIFYSGAFLTYAAVSMQLARNPRAAAQYNITPTSSVLEPVFSSVTVILLFVAPLLTMRLFSEEKKQGTMELMLTFPLRSGQMFAGKYLSVLSAYLVMLAITLVYPVILSAFVKVEWSVVSSAYLGMLLTGAAFLSVGLLASSWTSNQIVAAMVAFMVLLATFLMDFLAASASAPLSDILRHLSLGMHLRNFIRGVIDTRDIVYLLNVNILCGFLVLRSLEYYRWKEVVSTTNEPAGRAALSDAGGGEAREWGNKSLYLFIVSAVLLLIGISGWAGGDQFSPPPRWAYATIALGIVCFAYTMWISRGKLQGGMRLQSTRTGLQVALMILVVAAILVVVELASVKHFKRWDVTPGNFFSLSGKTRNLLSRLDREKRRIEIIAFTRKLEQPAIKEILEQYAQASKQVAFRFLDLDASPRTAKKYDVDAYGTLVVIHHFSKKEIEKMSKSASGDKKEQKTFRSEKIFDLSENAVANAILKTIQTEQKRVYYLTGHGERLFAGQGREVMKTLAIGMRDDNYQVDELLLLRKKGVPENTNLLIIAAPQKDLEEVEAGYIDDYIKAGGKLLVFLEPDAKRGRLTALLEKYGFKLPPSFVIDPQSVRFALAGGNEITPFAVNYGLHDITRQLKGLATVFPTARHVSAAGNPKAGLHSEDLVKTGAGSFTVEGVSLKDGELAFDPKTKKEGPVPLGAAVTVALDLYKLSQGQGEQDDSKAVAPDEKDSGKNEARIVVFGDADFASDAFIGAQGNANLIFNAVNWLGGEKDLITIRPKSRAGEPLLLAGGEGRFVHLFTVWVMPLFIIFAGAAVYVRRRQLR